MTLRFAPIDPVEAAIARLSFFRRSHFEARTDFEADLCEWFGINAGQARLLATLYAAERPMRLEALQRCGDLKSGSMPRYLVCVRGALPPGSIPRKDEDDAYQLTQLGRAACDEAVEHVGMGRLRKELAG